MLSSVKIWILSIVLISSGVVSLAMAMIYAVSYELPTLSPTLLTFLKPPYLYIIINGIIITIVVSSRFTRHEPLILSDDQSQPLISATTPPSVALEVLFYDHDKVFEVKRAVVFEDDDSLEVKKAVVVNGLGVAVEGVEVGSSRSTDTPLHKIASHKTETEAEIEIFSPVPVLSKFSHQNPQKVVPKGERDLKESNQDNYETLESIWKMITETHHVLPTRHFKKSDTFNENHRHGIDMTILDEKKSYFNPRMLESDTLKDHTNYHDLPMSFQKFTKEPSLSQDELNFQVEEFIRKFNEDMKLQKQESLKEYMEITNRGNKY